MKFLAAILAAAALVVTAGATAASTHPATTHRTTVSEQAFRGAMDDHLKLTTKEAVDELNGRWAASVADYDKVEAEILMMSQALSDGIIKQFPNRFAV